MVLDPRQMYMHAAFTRKSCQGLVAAVDGDQIAGGISLHLQDRVEDQPISRRSEKMPAWNQREKACRH
jgi:hypothetical protein